MKRRMRCRRSFGCQRCLVELPCAHRFGKREGAFVEVLGGVFTGGRSPEQRLSELGQ